SQAAATPATDTLALHDALPISGQKRRHLALVLLGGEGAGGIDDLAAGGQGFRGAVQDGGPQSRALGHQGRRVLPEGLRLFAEHPDRKSTRLNSSHVSISYAVFC